MHDNVLLTKPVMRGFCGLAFLVALATENTLSFLEVISHHLLFTQTTLQVEIIFGFGEAILKK